ncbi:COG1470 family protein [Thermococcus pacificus]|uniref:CARDB domain-containing protein n=1 Tax=Thermococcus pacificus TaxID=71998 RepID=A0A218P7S1_9EURY|nr:hypothetical protein [Thermococcus pacificus]ASJ06819.1 hypothetical protein A3L08_05545 [Thermococcus pacificus]
MRPRSNLLLLVALVLLFLPAVKASDSALFSIAPLNNNFTALPGDTVVVPFRLVNLGSEILENVTVYITGPAGDFLYQNTLISGPIPPGGDYNGTLTIKVLNTALGRYKLFLVARHNSTYSQAPVFVNVKRITDYSLGVDCKERYLIGKPVEVKLRITSKSNGILSGSVGYYIIGPSGTVLNRTTVTFVKPGQSWTQRLLLHDLPLGNYEVHLWANFSGVYKETWGTFQVYRRHLEYKVGFRDGEISVFVYNKTGSGVSDIPVTIGNTTLTTGDDGRLSVPVSEPGTYIVTLDLDGKIVRVPVEVKGLRISYEQNKTRLIVEVRDSNGFPVPNVTVKAVGALDRDYSVTNSSGRAVIDLRKTGYGIIILSAENSNYLGASATAKTFQPPTPTPTETNTTPSNSSPTTMPPITTTMVLTKPPKNYGPLPLILILSGILLAGTSYVAFFRPIVQEETIDRYYFVKVRAPKLKGLDSFSFEKRTNALEVRATKGKAKIEDGRVLWEIEHLEPGEEAYLQVLLG